MVNKQNRVGLTVTTSVSVSKELQKIMDQYNLSPTEVFRRGMGVTLCDLGVPPYCNSTLNKDRLEYLKKFMVSLEEAEKLAEFDRKLKKIEDFTTNATRIKNAAKKVLLAATEAEAILK